MTFTDPDEARRTILGLAGITTAVADQAQAMTDAELGERLVTGRWSTIEVHEAGRRLLARGAEELAPSTAPDSAASVCRGGSRPTT